MTGDPTRTFCMDTGEIETRCIGYLLGKEIVVV